MASPLSSLQSARFMKREQAEGEGKKGLKVAKQGALYVHRVGSNYLCEQCVAYISKRKRCYLILNSEGEIKPKATCGYFVKGKSLPDISPAGNLSKLEAGYIEPPNGVSCKQCEYFSAVKEDCQVVDKNSPGDDPGKIHPDACCANWEEDD